MLQAGAVKRSAAKFRAGKTGVVKYRVSHIARTKVRAGQIGVAAVGGNKQRVVRARVVEHRVAKMGLAQIGVAQIRFGEIRADQIGAP